MHFDEFSANLNRNALADSSTRKPNGDQIRLSRRNENHRANADVVETHPEERTARPVQRQLQGKEKRRPDIRKGNSKNMRAWARYSAPAAGVSDEGQAPSC